MIIRSTSLSVTSSARRSSSCVVRVEVWLAICAVFSSSPAFTSVGVTNLRREVLYEVLPSLSTGLCQNGRQLLAINRDHVTWSSSDHQFSIVGELMHCDTPDAIKQRSLTKDVEGEALVNGLALVSAVSPFSISSLSECSLWRGLCSGSCTRTHCLQFSPVSSC